MKLGLVIDLDTCVGCHACATACKEWNGASAISGPLSDYDPYGAEPSGVWFNRVRHYEVGEYPRREDDQLPDVVPALRGCGVRDRLPDRRLVQARRRHRARRPGPVHGLQPVRVGVPVRRARAGRGVRHDEEVHAVRRPHPRRALPEEERQPACVLACPTHARHFGDFDDPDSKVSRLTAERGGFGLLDELGYKPVNRYLPPREPPVAADATPTRWNAPGRPARRSRG